MTNGAAIGYMIIAAQEIGLKKETIDKLESYMHGLMDEIPEDVAEDVYRKS